MSSTDDETNSNPQQKEDDDAKEDGNSQTSSDREDGKSKGDSSSDPPSTIQNSDTEGDSEAALKSSKEDSEATLKSNKGDSGTTLKSNKGDSGTTLKSNKGDSGTTLKSNKGASGTSLKPNKGASGTSLKSNKGASGTSLKANKGASGTSLKSSKSESKEGRGTTEKKKSKKGSGSNLASKKNESELQNDEKTELVATKEKPREKPLVFMEKDENATPLRSAKDVVEEIRRLQALKMRTSMAQPKKKNVSEAQSKTESGSEAQQKTESGSEAQQKTERGSVAQSKTGSDSEAQQKTESGSEAQQKTESGPGAQQKTERGSVAQSKTGSGSEAQHKTKGSSVTQSKTKSDKEAAKAVPGGIEKLVSTGQDDAKKENAYSSPYVKKVAALLDDVEEMIKVSMDSMADVIPDWAKPELHVRFHMVNDGVMEPDPVGPVIIGLDLSFIKAVMKQFSNLTLNQIHHYSILGAHATSLYAQKQLVDVIIRVDDAVFSASRISLSCHSDLFADIFLNSLVPPYALTEITLQDVDKDLFKSFIHFVYYGEVAIDESNVNGLLTMSEILQSKSMRSRILMYCGCKVKVTLYEAIVILNNDPTTLDRRIATQAITNSFRELLEEPILFQYIGLEDMTEIIQSNDLYIWTELDVFWAVLYWTIVDKKSRLNEIDALMSYVRFSCMSSLEILDCARANHMMSISTTCKQLLVKAHWISHAHELGLEDPLLLKPEIPRSHLVNETPYVPTVKYFDSRFIALKLLIHGPYNEEGTDKTKTVGKEKKSKKNKKRKTPKQEPKIRPNTPNSTRENYYSDEDTDADTDDGEEDEEAAAKAAAAAKKAAKKAQNKKSGTHELRGGVWKRKRFRGSVNRRVDINKALQGLVLDDEDLDDSPEKTHGVAPSISNTGGVEDGADPKQGPQDKNATPTGSDKGKDKTAEGNTKIVSFTGSVIGGEVSTNSKTELKPAEVSTDSKNESKPGEESTASKTQLPKSGNDSPEGKLNSLGRQSPEQTTETQKPEGSEKETKTNQDEAHELQTQASQNEHELSKGNTSQNYRYDLETPQWSSPAFSDFISLDDELMIQGEHQYQHPQQRQELSLLDEPDVDMIQHLHPVLQPIPSKMVTKRLHRKTDKTTRKEKLK